MDKDPAGKPASDLTRTRAELHQLATSALAQDRWIRWRPLLDIPLLALFIALNKRKGEMEKLGENGDTRGVLRHYSQKSIQENARSMCGFFFTSSLMRRSKDTFSSSPTSNGSSS